MSCTLPLDVIIIDLVLYKQDLTPSCSAQVRSVFIPPTSAACFTDLIINMHSETSGSCRPLQTSRGSKAS